MPVDAVAAFLLTNWMILIAAAFGVTILAWIYVEWEEDRDAQEVGRAVGDRTRRTVGGAAGLSAGILTGVLGGLYEAGMTFGDAFEVIGDMLVTAPQLFAGLSSIGLGWAWLQGWVPLDPVWYLGVAMIVVGLGALASMRVNDGWPGGT